MQLEILWNLCYTNAGQLVWYKTNMVYVFKDKHRMKLMKLYTLLVLEDAKQSCNLQDPRLYA